MELDRRGAPDPDLDNATAKATLAAPLDEHGDFHFSNVPPAKYVLVVDCVSASAVREVRVQLDNAQTEKDTRIPPFRLEELTLNVAITPKLDPTGKPWQLVVDATMPRLRRIAATTMTDGHWAKAGLSAGNYRVSISSSDGKPWLQRFFNLSASSGPLSVRLPFMRVEGVVRLATKPVRARLTFFNESGGEPAMLTSGNDGVFRGVVPVAPDAEKTFWTVEVRAAQPPITRRLTGISVPAGETSAWLDLQLPLYAVHGTVVSQKAQAQSGVQVTVEEASSGIRTSTATNEDGGFQLNDLPPGKYTAVAECIEGTSGRTQFKVVDGTESELKLVLNPSEQLSFFVFSSAGPVENAEVQVWISPGEPWFSARTDADGRFQVKLPPGTAEVGLTIAARSYPVKLTRLRVPSQRDDSPNGANTITLDDSGGTLVLDLAPPSTAESSSTPYLVHDGSMEAAGTLVGWSANQSYIGGGGPSVVEAIAPGDYALCFVQDPAQLTALWSGAIPADRCRKGSVEEGGTLTLTAR